MDKRLEQVALAAGTKQDVAETLDGLLGPGDQAWVVCSYTECVHCVRGTATFTR
jgi:hypothetical protein